MIDCCSRLATSCTILPFQLSQPLEAVNLDIIQRRLFYAQGKKHGGRRRGASCTLSMGMFNLTNVSDERLIDT
jgi:hypothetical protein